MQTLNTPFNPSLLPVFQPGLLNGFANDAIWYRVNMKVNAIGVLTVTGPDGIVTLVNLAAGLTQDIPALALPAQSYVSAVRIKTNVASVGTATLTALIGVTATNNFFLSAAFNLAAAPSATNFAPASSAGNGVGNNTTAAIATVVGLTATVNNLSLLTAGEWDVWFQVNIMP